MTGNYPLLLDSVDINTVLYDLMYKTSKLIHYGRLAEAEPDPRRNSDATANAIALTGCPPEHRGVQWGRLRSDLTRASLFQVG